MSSVVLVSPLQPLTCASPVMPGITGLAQVNGCRGETRTTEDMQKRVNFDLYYIQRWNFWLDLQIIIQTIINIFRGDQNAY